MKIFPVWIKFDKIILSIILWNLTPYWGVFFLEWEPITVLICYALETVVIGGFNIFKMFAVYWSGKPEEDTRYVPPGFFAIPFFFASYNFLVFFQLTAFFACIDVITVENQFTVIDAVQQFMSDETTYYAFTAFVVLNGYEFVTDYMLQQQYTYITLREQMTEPLPRVIFIQAVVTGAGFVFLNTGSNLAVLICFSLLKIICEVVLRKYTISELFSD